MRIGLLILTLAGALGAAESKEIHRTIPLDTTGRLVIETYKGSVRVSTWDRNEVDIAVRIEEDWGLMADSIRNADLRVDTGLHEVRLESHYRRPTPFDLSGSQPLFHYTIRMPRSANLRIKDYKSSSEVDGLTGDLEVNTYKGTLRVRDLEGALAVTTYKGDVRAEFAKFSARSRVETHKGTVELRLPRESRFDLRTELGRKSGLNSDFRQMESVRTSSYRYRRANRSMDGAVNGGGPELRLKSDKGTFRVRER